MAPLFTILQGAAGLAAFVCFVLVVIQIFQHGETGLGIACVVLVFCVGIGYLIAFVYGWMKSNEWGIKNIMLAWTGCLVAAFVFAGLSIAMMPQMQQMN